VGAAVPAPTCRGLGTCPTVLPDPRIAERPFLALPLRELAPDLVIPGSGRPIREIAAELDGRDMRPLPEYTEALRREVANGQREDRALGR
jgi:hypothetical protein